MKRTTNQHSLVYMLFRANSKGKAQPKTHKENELTVTINLLAGRKAIYLRVPHRCNIKILRSMVHFHLKKSLTPNQYALMIGLESDDANYELDYLLQNGIGVLQNNISLNCLERSEPKPKGSILNYKICKLISVGGFSKVYLLRDLTNGQFRAGKFIAKQNANKQMVQNQYQLSANINHPFLLQTYQMIETEHFYLFVLEFYPGGELFELLKRNRHMPETKARFYVVQALLALKHIHERSIVFRDIKPENMLLDQKGHLRLVDFGLAKQITRKAYSFCGSLDYMAPEVLKDEGHSFEADYYSIGNLMFEILVGSPPFYHPKFAPEETKFHILNTPVRFPEYLKLSKSAIDLMKKLLTKEPSERLGFIGGIDAILAHQWFEDINIQDYMNKEIDPPIAIESRITFFKEQNTSQKAIWDSLMDKDIKEQAMKEAMRTINTIKGNRHRSLNSLKSSDDKSSQGGAKTPQGRTNARLKSNMCLLYVLTHKRAASEGPNSPKSAKFKQPTPQLALKSTNLSRKSSLLKRSQSRMQSSVESPVISGYDWMVEGKEKESGIKKRKKENRPFLRQKVRR